MLVGRHKAYRYKHTDGDIGRHRHTETVIRHTATCTHRWAHCIDTHKEMEIHTGKLRMQAEV